MAGAPLALRGAGRRGPLQVGVEPALDGARGDGQVGGDVLVRPAPVGQADDLEAVAELGVGFLAESLVEPLGFLGGKRMRITRLSLREVVYPPSLYAPDSLIERLYEGENRLGW